MDPPPAGDIPYSYSRPDLVAVIHTRLVLSVNFGRKVLEGRAILTIEKKVSTCNELVLDNYRLRIGDVTDYSTGESLRKTIDSHNNNFGSKFTITLPSVDSAVGTAGENKRMKVSDNKYEIQIEYETDPKSPALYWLQPEQTPDGEHPLLISNSKLTYARAIFPCQDTPSNRITFSSEITVPKAFKVMMPGIEEQQAAENNQDKYLFFLGTPCDTTQPRQVRIPPYAIHIIVGTLRSFHRRREEEDVSRSVYLDIWETGEKSCQRRTEFLDKIVDILYNIKESHGFLMGILSEVNVFVLPPNVPEFDMQYPYMTFVSSSLLEGQYSIIDTIVQNIIESWIGRTVTIDNFKHLWLIKGLSTFIYRNRINDKIIDKEMKFRTDLEIKGINNLLSMPELQTDSLVPDLTGKLPMNIIKYVSEKGCAFLNHLQDMLGGPEEFKDFLHTVLPLPNKDRGILTTDRFKNLLNTYFQRKGKNLILNKIDTEWDRWLNEPGYPASQSHIMTIKKTHWQRQADQWIAQETPSFDTIENLDQSNDLVIIEFLTYLLALPTGLPKDKLRMIEHEFLRDQKICEIRFLWLRLCIKSEWLDDGRIQEDALKFACEYCMPKYACPIFRDLYNLAKSRTMAIRLRFVKPDNRSKMLPETIKELESILEI